MMDSSMYLFFLLLVGNSFAKPSILNPEVIQASLIRSLGSEKPPVDPKFSNNQYQTATEISFVPIGLRNSVSSQSAEEQKNTENKYNFQEKNFEQTKESINSGWPPPLTYVRRPIYDQYTEELPKQQIKNLEKNHPLLGQYSIPIEQSERITESRGSNQQLSNNQESSSVDSITSLVSPDKCASYKPLTAILTDAGTKSSHSSSVSSYNQLDSSSSSISSFASTKNIEPHIATAPALTSAEKKLSYNSNQAHNIQQIRSLDTILPIHNAPIEIKSSPSSDQSRINEQPSSSDTISSFLKTSEIKPNIPQTLTDQPSFNSNQSSNDENVLLSKTKYPIFNGNAQPIVAFIPIKTAAAPSTSMNLHGEVNNPTTSSSTVSAHAKHLSSPLTEINTNSGKSTKKKHLNRHDGKKNGKLDKKHKTHHQDSSHPQRLNSYQESLTKHKIHNSHHHKNIYSKNKTLGSAHHKQHSDTRKSHHKHDTKQKYKSEENFNNKINSCPTKMKEKTVNNEHSKLHKEVNSKPSENVVIERKIKNELKHKNHSMKHHKNKEGNKNKKHSSSFESKHHHKIKKSVTGTNIATASSKNFVSLE